VFKLAYLLFLPAAASIAIAQTQEPAIDAQHLVVMVLHNRAVGVVKLNGIPIAHLDSSGAEEGNATW
jgi:hypothetical protein